MGLFDRNWGMNRSPRENDATAGASEDDRAIARYRYMLRTAPPEAIEQVHAEAFAQLTPEQRRQVLAKLADEAPAKERAAIEEGGTNPQALARAATRAEIRQPGVLERVLAPAPGFGSGTGGGLGSGFGGMLAGSLLGSVAGTVLGSAIAHQFFSHDVHAAAADHAAGLFGNDAMAGAGSAHDVTPGGSQDDAGIDRLMSGDQNAGADSARFVDSDTGVGSDVDSGLDTFDDDVGFGDGGDFDSGSFDV